MSPHPLAPDDPRLTAYALDELESDEKREFERALEAQPEARVWIEEIRTVTGSLESALQAEPSPERSIRPEHVLAANPAPRRPKLFRFPHLYFVVSGLAAACFAVFVALHDHDQERSRRELAKDVVAEMDQPVATKASRMVQASGAVEDKAIAVVGSEFVATDAFFPVASAATSTFPLHVGHESYDAVRRALAHGHRPPRAAVQVAEMINAFSYSWPQPEAGSPFATVLEESSAPWNPAHRLVRVGVHATGAEGQKVADDAHVDVTFNAGRVGAWRLIGFNRDRPEVGLAGAGGEPMFGGSSMTVLYELIPSIAAPAGAGPDLLTLELHYRRPDSDADSVASWALPAAATRFADASADMKFVATVAAFGLGLRGGDPTIAVAAPILAEWAGSSAQSPERAEFIDLMKASDHLAR